MGCTSTQSVGFLKELLELWRAKEQSHLHKADQDPTLGPRSVNAGFDRFRRSSSSLRS